MESQLTMVFLEFTSLSVTQTPELIFNIPFPCSLQYGSLTHPRRGSRHLGGHSSKAAFTGGFGIEISIGH